MGNLRDTIQIEKVQGGHQEVMALEREFEDFTLLI